MRKKLVVVILIIVFMLVTIAGCSSSQGNSVPNYEVESTEFKKEITNIKLNNSEDIEIVVGSNCYNIIFVQGYGYDNYSSEIEFISTNSEVATIKPDKSNSEEIWCRIDGILPGTTTIYAQTKDGKLTTDKKTVTVISKNETSELSEKSDNSIFAEKSSGILYNKNNIKIVYNGISDKNSKKLIDIYIENNSNNNITVQARDFSINGYMITPIFSSHISSEKKINDSISVYKNELEKNNIDKIKNIELKFLIFTKDDMSDYFYTETIKFSV